MSFAAIILRIFCRRNICALLLAAFLIPAPTPTPAEEVRALYAVQGLLCTDDADGRLHREAHCVLCLVAELDTAPESRATERRLTVEIIVHPIEQRESTATSVGSHRARAPPFQFA